MAVMESCSGNRPLAVVWDSHWQVAMNPASAIPVAALDIDPPRHELLTDRV